MKSSKLSPPTLHSHSCGFPGCSKPAPLKCSRCREVRYCSKEHQTTHWRLHKKLCAPPGEKISWPAAPTPAPPAGPIAAKASPPIVTPVAAPGSFAAPAAPAPVKSVEEVDDSDKCIICMDRVVNVKFKGCSHSMTCRECTDETIRRGLPCPLCRKPISGYEVGKFIDSIGAHGLWPTSLKNLTQLASGEGFNEYFQDLFVGNEASYLRWKEVFDVLELVGVGAEGGGESLEQQVLTVTGSEDLDKLRALEKLCSREFFDDPSLLVAVSRRILEVLVLAMPAPVEEKKVRGKKKKGKKKKVDARKVVVLDACLALGKACNMVRDMEDARRYFKRAKEGYEEQLGPDSEKALEVTRKLIMVTCSSIGELIDKLKVLVERMVGALGEENAVTLDTLNDLGAELQDNGELEEARTVYERCFAGRVKVLGEHHKDTLAAVNNLGIVYDLLKQYEKALEYYKRALKGYEKTLGKTHPSTLNTVMNIAVFYENGLKDYGKAEELYQRALEGYEAQLGKDHEYTKHCARNFRNCLNANGNTNRLKELKKEYPNVESY